MAGKISTNMSFVNQVLTQNFTIFLLLLFIISLVILLKNQEKYSGYEKLLFFWTLSVYFVYISIIPKNEVHYLTPLFLLALVSLWAVLRKSVFIPILFLLTFFVLSQFPVKLWQNSTRPISRFEEVAKYVTTNFPDLKTSKVNLIQISNNEVSVPVGHEYRYFLENKGLHFLTGEEYSQADILIVVSEIPGFEIKSLDNWEINQFGKNFKILSRNKVENMDIYLLKK